MRLNHFPRLMLNGAAAAFVLSSTCGVGLAQPANKRAIPAQPTMLCDIDAFTPPPGVTIVSVHQRFDPVPLCRVQGFVTTTDPGPNKVGFLISMPTTWNGRYLMMPPGGSAGYLMEPQESRLKEGYIFATTDKGSHAPTGVDNRFRASEARSTDYAHRGAHVATVATQAIAREYYGGRMMIRYIQGCSGGGVSAQTEAELYPEDADAFIIGAPAPNDFIMTYWGYIASHLYRNPASWISEPELKRIGEVIVSRYDAADGARDGVVLNPSDIRIEPSMFPFLSAAQFSTLKILVDGLPNVPGGPDVHVPGFWLTNPEKLGAALLGSAPPPWTKATQPILFGAVDDRVRAFRGKDFNLLTDMNYNSVDDLTKEYAGVMRWKAANRPPTPANLGRARQLGKKVLLWHGNADNLLPPLGAQSYAEQVRTIFPQQGQDFFRAFMIPNLLHCAGGQGAPADTPDRMLEAAVAWVEEAKAPDSLVLTTALPDQTTPSGEGDEIARSYRVCPLPMRARYTGNAASQAEIADARFWTCR
ncbi:tannase/feruloyl esterase family alpha/beta hydrolase [Novosphingobium aquimarinum]|uniref:tannase/feruloyl esterase family alpha/beta hydrolase n=1 Tax=Novosphingobium aquimarinum TaxID=2682494 RepID=UPI0012EC438A|nr:tannase/feruloyl esterase family alpha/beta hydrolase [Novosphingobium aquimarinum]